MIATGLSALIFIIGIANICHPITTLWGETTNGSCDLKLNSDVSFFFSAIEIATDWSLAILPGVLLWNVQMKSRVKMSVAIILGLAAL
jgi:tetrahydromethanopterin S-methyltransferase subunit C